MTLVGLWGLDRGSMWQDEEASYDASRRSWPQLWSLVRHTDAVHAVYYALLHPWMATGGGEVWMRLPSVVGAAVSAGLVTALTTRLANRRAGLLAGLVFVSLPLVSFYAQEARSYAVVMTAVLVATWFLVRAGDDPGRHGWASGVIWVGYAGALSVAVLLNELSLLAVGAHAVTLAWWWVRPRVWLAWSVCVGAAVVVATPVVVLSTGQAGQVDWIPRPSWHLVEELPTAFAGRSVVGVVVLALAVAAAVSGRPSRRHTVVTVAAPLLVVPPLLLVGLSALHPLLVVRYVLYSVAGLAMLAGAGFGRLVVLAPSRRSGMAHAGLAVVAMLVVAGAQLGQQRSLRTADSRLDDLAGAARVVQDHAVDGDGVLFMPSRFRSAALAYPRAFARVRDLSLALSPAASGTLRGVDRPTARTRSAMIASGRLWVVGRPGLGVAHHELGARREQATLMRWFRIDNTVVLHGIQVSLFRRRPTPVRGPDG